MAREMCQECCKFGEGYFKDKRGRFFCSLECYRDKEFFIGFIGFGFGSIAVGLLILYSMYWGWQFKCAELKQYEAKTEVLRRTRDVTSYQGIWQ